jgi:hypothetical protein
MHQDQIKITILDDGLIKVETDAISAPNHVSADELLKLISRLMGGEETRTKRFSSQTHAHTHVRQ